MPLCYMTHVVLESSTVRLGMACRHHLDIFIDFKFRVQVNSRIEIQEKNVYMSKMVSSFHTQELWSPVEVRISHTVQDSCCCLYFQPPRFCQHFQRNNFGRRCTSSTIEVFEKLELKKGRRNGITRGGGTV